MKRRLHKFILLFFITLSWILAVKQVQAQTWKWGRSTSTGGADAYLDCTDLFGNIYAAGWQFEDTLSFGTIDIPNTALSFVVKYDSAGNAIWAKGIIPVYDSALPFSGADPESITTDTAGNLILLGNFSGHVSIDTFNLYSICVDCSQYFLAKFDSAGNVLWVKASSTAAFFGGFASATSDARILIDGGVATDVAGNIFITGNYDSTTTTIGTTTLTNANPGTDDIFVARYDPNGNVVWAKSIGGDYSDDAVSITVASTGNVYISGMFISDSMAIGDSMLYNPYGVQIAHIAEFSSSGAPLWGTAAGGPNGAYGIGLTKDISGNVYLTGAYGDSSITFCGTTINQTYPGAGYLSVFLISLSSSHTVPWQKTIGSPTSSLAGYSIALASCGEVWVSGGWLYSFAEFSDSANIDGHILYTPDSSDDPVFLAGYNISGGVIGSGVLSSGGDDQNQIACDPEGNVYLCSDIKGFGLLAVGPDTLTRGASDLEVFYLARYNNDSLSIIRHITTQSDTFLCSNNGLLLKTPPGYTDPYLWSNSTVGNSLHVDTSGTYWLNCESVNACIPTFLTDTFHVSFYNVDTVRSIKDTALCYGTIYTLAIPADNSFYQWSNGDTGSSIILPVQNDTTIWVSCIDSCIHFLADTFHIASLSVAFSLPADTFVCGGPVTLHIPETGVAYNWQNESTKQDYTTDSSGIYHATVSKNGCAYTDSIAVQILYLTSINFDTIVCADGQISIPLNSSNIPGASVMWSTGEQTSTIIVADTGMYYAAIRDSICSTTDTMHIGGQMCHCWCVIPTAFTPKGSVNKGLKPIIEPGCIVNNYTFSIFNRWGQVVFISNDPTQYWDGTFNGIPVDLGVYMYELFFDGGLEHKKFFRKGDVTLVR